MLRASITFFVIALLSYVFGAYSIAGVSMEIGSALLWVFLILGVISLSISAISGRNPRPLV